jgi:glyoxylase-like metal-dependent hydrolase (beta-lactamase superfamily II)
MASSPIACPFPEPPARLSPVVVAPGVLWLRLPLPYSLNHVNVYLVEDDGGWTLIDTGLGDSATLELWQDLLRGPLAGMRLNRVIVTHCHPDHVGASGFLCETLGLELSMSFSEFFTAQHVVLDPSSLEGEHYARFYRDHGLDPVTTASVMTRGHDYLRKITGLPSTFRRMIAGETLHIGGRRFEILTGGGHSPEQVMLLCAEERLFFAADQVMLRISPNVSVMAIDPQGDPLGIYLRSLAALRDTVSEDTLVLPGHYHSFTGLHARIAELIAHHEERCALILKACREAPRSAAELVPVIFPRVLDPHQMGFAFSEVLAHTNFMSRAGTLGDERGADAVIRFRPR